MTDQDKHPFVQAFNVLAVATRLSDADATMQRIYFDGLKDLSVESVTAAAGEMAKTAQWFPKVAEWRSAAKVQAIAHIKALPPGREEPWQDECGACLDTGWEEKRCYPGTANNCGRRKCANESVRPEHKYSVACACRETNHTFKRHHIGAKASYSEYT